MSPELEEPIRSESEALVDCLRTQLETLANTGRVEDLKDIYDFTAELLNKRYARDCTERHASLKYYYSCESQGAAK